MPKSARRQFLVTVQSLPGYWAKLSGGEVMGEVNKHWDGGSLNADATTGNINFSDLVVSRPYDANRDAPVEALMSTQIAQPFTVSRQPTDPNLIPIGNTTTWTAILKHVLGPEVDADSGDVGLLQLTFETMSKV